MIRTCTSCSQQNRVPAKHLAQTGRCGKCHAALAPLSTPLNVNPDTFHDIVRNASVPVLVDFWAEWCGPCKMATPEVKKAAAELSGKAIVLKVNTESHPTLAQEFGVSGIPNFAVLKDGKVKFQQAGLVNHQTMKRWVEDAAS